MPLSQEQSREFSRVGANLASLLFNHLQSDYQEKKDIEALRQKEPKELFTLLIDEAKDDEKFKALADEFLSAVEKSRNYEKERSEKPNFAEQRMDWREQGQEAQNAPNASEPEAPVQRRRGPETNNTAHNRAQNQKNTQYRR